MITRPSASEGQKKALFLKQKVKNLMQTKWSKLFF